MSAVFSRFPIHPKQAVEKFLVDMRIASERAFRRWNLVLVEAIDDCPLSPRERAGLLQSHPIDDYFFAGVVALHAQAVRRLFPADVAESLMRELAVQVDGGVGRRDSVVSHLVFMALTRIRRAHLSGNDLDHDQVIETLLERIGVDKRKATRHLMTQLLLRQTLGETLVFASPGWWQAFSQIYSVMKPPRTEPAVPHVTVIDPASGVVTARHRPLPPAPAWLVRPDLPAQMMRKTNTPKSDHFRQ